MFHCTIINRSNMLSHANFLQAALTLQQLHGLEASRDLNQGFIITHWSMNELIGLIQNGSALFIFREQETLIGYTMVSPIQDFLIQIEESVNSTFNSRPCIENPEQWKYIYQIAVNPTFSHQGKAEKLISFVLATYPHCLFVADFMIAPRNNTATARLAQKLNFHESGTFELASYRGMPPTKWQIVTSTNEKS